MIMHNLILSGAGSWIANPVAMVHPMTQYNDNAAAKMVSDPTEAFC